MSCEYFLIPHEEVKCIHPSFREERSFHDGRENGNGVERDRLAKIVEIILGVRLLYVEDIEICFLEIIVMWREVIFVVGEIFLLFIEGSLRALLQDSRSEFFSHWSF